MPPPNGRPPRLTECQGHKVVRRKRGLSFEPSPDWKPKLPPAAPAIASKAPANGSTPATKPPCPQSKMRNFSEGRNFAIDGLKPLTVPRRTRREALGDQLPGDRDQLHQGNRHLVHLLLDLIFRNIDLRVDDGCVRGGDVNAPDPINVLRDKQAQFHVAHPFWIKTPHAGEESTRLKPTTTRVRPPLPYPNETRSQAEDIYSWKYFSKPAPTRSQSRFQHINLFFAVFAGLIRPRPPRLCE